jgi:hypothetical protein
VNQQRESDASPTKTGAAQSTNTSTVMVDETSRLLDRAELSRVISTGEAQLVNGRTEQVVTDDEFERMLAAGSPDLDHVYSTGDESVAATAERFGFAAPEQGLAHDAAPFCLWLDSLAGQYRTHVAAELEKRRPAAEARYRDALTSYYAQPLTAMLYDVRFELDEWTAERQANGGEMTLDDGSPFDYAEALATDVAEIVWVSEPGDLSDEWTEGIRSYVFENFDPAADLITESIELEWADDDGGPLLARVVEHEPAVDLGAWARRLTRVAVERGWYRPKYSGHNPPEYKQPGSMEWNESVAALMAEDFEPLTMSEWAAGQDLDASARAWLAVSDLQRQAGETGLDKVGLRLTNAPAVTAWLRLNLGQGKLGGFFLRGGRIVWTPRLGEEGYVPPPSNTKDKDGPAQVRDIEKAGTLRAMIHNRVHPWRVKEYEDEKSGEKKRKKVPAMFPTAPAQHVFDAPSDCLGLRPLVGVTHVPLPRADGTLLAKPGYDEATGLLYLPHAGLNVPAIPDAPTSSDVANAVELLDRLFGEFPFVSDDMRANYYGMLLTPLLRLIAPPAYKMFIIDAPQRGSGKSLLTKVARAVHGGVVRGEFPSNDEELGKVVLSILTYTTAPIVEFDNVAGMLRSPKLDSLLTQAQWTDRLLGQNRNVTVPNDRLWIATGNNLQIGGDLARRVIWVTIDPKMPKPETRTGFAIPDLEGYATDHRGEILAALLTLVRAWVTAGKPLGRPRLTDSFATYVHTVEAILKHAEVAGTFDAPGAAKDAVNPEADEFEQFLASVHRTFGGEPWTVADVLDRLDISLHTDAPTNPAKPIKLEELPSQLAEKMMRATTGPKAIAKSLGMWLNHRDGTFFGDVCARKHGDKRNGSALWVIEEHK